MDISLSPLIFLFIFRFMPFSLYPLFGSTINIPVTNEALQFPRREKFLTAGWEEAQLQTKFLPKWNCKLSVFFSYFLVLSLQLH